MDPHLNKFIELLRVVAHAIPHSPESETQAALERRRDAFLYIWRRLQGDKRVLEFCREFNEGEPRYYNQAEELLTPAENQAEGIARAAKLARNKWLPNMLALREELEREADSITRNREQYIRKRAEYDPFLTPDTHFTRDAFPSIKERPLRPNER
jgi:murein L,D-transpeptidase YcbB/YkuD